MQSRHELSRVDRPTRNRSVLWVERLKKDDQQSFILASAKLFGFHTHWTGAKTVPCWQNHDFCEGGHKEESLRENFLLQAWSLKRGKMVFLYLTPQAAEQLEDQVGAGVTLRGVPVVVTRTKANNGRLNIVVSEFTTAQKLSTREVDPWESIMVFLKVPREIRDQRRSLGTIPVFTTGGRVNGECLKSLVSD